MSATEDNQNDDENDDTSFGAFGDAKTIVVVIQLN